MSQSRIASYRRPSLDGDLLAKAMWSRGYSYAAFAKAAGISQPTLRRALAGRPLNLGTAMKIAAAIHEREALTALTDLIAS